MLWIAAMFATSLSQADENKLFTQLDQLQTLLNIPHEKTRESMVEASQVWRRKPDTERWQMKALDVSPAVKERAMDMLNQMGLVNELKPDKQHYDYVLWLGATIPRMETRLNQIAKLWGKGVTADHIISLTGQRPLTPTIDQPDLLIEKTGIKDGKLIQPQNETESAIMLWAVSSLPKTMRDHSCHFISVPRTWNNNHWQRPNTRDTLRQWLTTNPRPGSVLVISDQPHAGYQKTVVEDELPSSFSVSVSAQKAGSQNGLEHYLDALALMLHNMPKT